MALYALDTRNHLIACGGCDRGVHVVDARRWTPAGRWSQATKYEITALHFSGARPDLVHVASLDHEVSTCAS